jgi:hypothetical protein
MRCFFSETGFSGDAVIAFAFQYDMTWLENPRVTWGSHFGFGYMDDAFLLPIVSCITALTLEVP